MTGSERPRFFEGKLLTAADLELEQRYHLDHRRRLSRLLHGWGVVSGLEVSAGGDGTVTVAPGFAIDPFGREVVVCDSTTLEVDPGEGPVEICLSYAEVETDAGTVRETYELSARTKGNQLDDAVVVVATVTGATVEAGRRLPSTASLLDRIRALEERLEAS